MAQLIVDWRDACEPAEDLVLVVAAVIVLLLLQLSQNQRAQQAYEDHAKELHLFRRRYFNASTNMRRSNVEHRRIFEAIVAGSADKANKLAQAHVLQGRQRLLTTLDAPLQGNVPATKVSASTTARRKR